MRPQPAIMFAIFCLFAVTPAQAQLKLCNETSYVLDAAIAESNKSGWRISGWFRLYPGFCEIAIKKRLKRKIYYVHARSAPAHAGAVKLFGGVKIFCVSPRRNRFLIKTRILCREKGGEKTGFARLEIGAPRWTHYFREHTPFHTNKHAMVAGIQRLLRENGFQIGDIDGFWGKRTRRLIMAFQKSANRPQSGIITERLFDRLLVESQKKLGVRSGFKLCNQTDYLIWAAVGYRAIGSKENYREPHFESKGWLRIYPKNCAMLLREKLGQLRYYIYAEAVDKHGNVVQKSSGKPLIWFGQFPMCLRRLQFKIAGNTECARRGFQTARFRRIETKGRPGWTEYLSEQEDRL